MWPAATKTPSWCSSPLAADPAGPAVQLTVANSASGDDGPEDNGGDTAITGAALQRASAVALEHTGGGRVVGSEIDDEESKYEIEVTLHNGDQVDVQLDEHFNVVSSENDGPGSDD